MHLLQCVSALDAALCMVARVQLRFAHSTVSSEEELQASFATDDPMRALRKKGAQSHSRISRRFS